MARAKEESRLNKLGIQGLGFDMGEYENFMQNYNTANDISSLPRSSSIWNAIKNEFSGSAQAAGIPINNNQSILPKARPRMTANWSQFDDAESRNLDSQRQMELAKLVNQGGQYLTEEEDENKWNMPNWDTVRNVGTGIWSVINKSVPWGWGSNALNFMGGKGNPMNMFNRNRPTPAQQRANQNYMNQQRITRDPQTGRMIGGNFAGLNAPGTSFFGSKTFQEMANKQIAKYGKTAPKAKVDAWKAVVTGGRDPSQGNTHTGHGKSGMGRDPNDRMAQGGLASLWQR